MGFIPVVVAEGEPYDIGRSYGYRTAELVAGNLASYAGKFRLAGLDPAGSRRMGEEFRDTSHRLTPRIAQALDGLADGAGVAASDIYALNARTELMAPSRPRVTECTAVAVLPQYTADGHLLLAQNWDWHPDQQPYTVVLGTATNATTGLSPSPRPGCSPRPG